MDSRATEPVFDTETSPLTGPPSLSGAALRGEAEGARGTLVPLITSLRTAERVVVDAALLDAFQAAASKHTLAALRSDLFAFDLWCREQRRITVPARSEDVADYLKSRGGQGARPASLARYKASIARLHQLLGLIDPTTAPLVKLTLAAIRKEKGVAQRQAAPLRFKGAVSDIERDPARGLNLRALLESCAEDLVGLRDRALLSLAYDTGLRASELVAVKVGHILPATDPDARLLSIPRSKSDSEGEGATAFLSPRTVRAVKAWMEAGRISEGAVFRRVFVRRYKGRARVPGRDLRTLSGREAYDWRKALPKPAVPARTEYSIGDAALHPGSIGPIWRAIIRRAFEKGALPDLTRDDLDHWLKRISGHSTRVGLNQDLFASGEDLAGIMDALRWKSPRMPLAYNRNLAAENGAAGRLMKKLG